VLGVGGAAPVAEEEDLMPPLESGDQNLDDLHERVAVGANEARLDFGAFLKGLEDFIFHKIDLGKKFKV
jgi:hypothetical protein